MRIILLPPLCAILYHDQLAGPIVNRIYYDEHRPRHRRCVHYYRRTLAVGAVPLALALALAAAYFPRIGPGLFANAGLTLAGLMTLWSVRDMQTRAPVSRWGRWIVSRMDDLFPALLIGLQGWFVLMTTVLIWFTVAELGFRGSIFSGCMLFGILLLAPIRRILAGTEPPHPHPLRELLSEGLGHLNTILVTLFVAGSLTSLNRPDPTNTEPPMMIIVIWLAATLVILTCVILFLDHIVRKMPPIPREEPADTLD